jgi:hypothetical protein
LVEARTGSESPKLTLVVDNREPLALEEVIALLDALAKDYRQFARRDLTLLEVRQGSTHFDLVDLGVKTLALMGAVVTVRDFAKIVASIIDRAKEGRLDLRGSRVQGSRTARAFVRTSRTSHASLEFTATGVGQPFKMRLSRSEAERIYLVERDDPVKAHAEPRSVYRQADAAILAIEDFATAAASVSDDPAFLEGNPAFELARTLIREFKRTRANRDALVQLSDGLRREGKTAASRLLEALLVE